jgi:ADP-heptose:LPS heptosyltransferase
LDGWPDDPGDRLVAIAAALRGMDLLVCADNSVAHIAGAMGVRTCLVLAVSPDSRWLLNREDSPWYPTMRLFRQRYRGDWDDVATRLALELEREFLTDGQRERNQRGNAEGGEIPGAAERGRAEM